MAQNNCGGNKSCSGHASHDRKRFFAWLPAILVAILPKCPFCLMAYTGAVSLCSGNMLYPNSGTLASYVTTALALVVLFSILLNRKGRKTWFALGFAVMGMFFLVLGQFYLISEFNYYLGVILLFFGIWLNGSFLHYYRKFLALRVTDTNKI